MAKRLYRILVVLVIYLFGHICLFLLKMRKHSNEHVHCKGATPHRCPKRILVTGVAGFIGFHVAKTLSVQESNVVVGIDNFNEYYDQRLKIDRAYELNELGVDVYYEDLCTQELLIQLFDRHEFTHVIHLAAQAGVRYSLKNPLAYLQSNVACYLTLLEVLKNKRDTKLIYASSSSVYGKNSSVPFRISATTDQPGNMYAATKRINELYTSHYCYKYGLQAVGLRFFTVYGPWGRPDMAVYKFADAILRNKELPLFHQSDHNPLQRDFTYIDDIVDGILSALDLKSVVCGERFNLGFGRPVSVSHLIALLDMQLGRKANVKFLPIPPTEILKTWADISTSVKLLHFKPSVGLAEGLRRFVDWFKAYRKERAEDRHGRDLWFERLLQDRLRRRKIYEENKKADPESLPADKQYNLQLVNFQISMYM